MFTFMQQTLKIIKNSFWFTFRRKTLKGSILSYCKLSLFLNYLSQCAFFLLWTVTRVNLLCFYRFKYFKTTNVTQKDN